MDQSKRHAEIAGAGLAGLMAATMLGQEGWSVAVHERGSELREIGAGIGMWRNGLWALDQVGLYGEITAAGEPVDRWEIFDEQVRQLQSQWMAPDMSSGECTILRRDLHAILANAAVAAGAEIHTGSTVAGATREGELVLASGERRRADLVVGADGVNSKVRDTLGLTLRVEDTRDGCGRHLARREPGERARRLEEHWQGPRRVGVVPAAPDQLYVYLCCPADDEAGRAQEDSRDTWIHDFPHLADLIARIPDGGRWASFANVTVSSWSAGRVALVGDAAHSMAPSLGQAANVAFCNVVALGQALRAYGDDLEGALKAWEASERHITDATQRSSDLYGRVGIKWPKDLYAVRSVLVWALGRSAALQQRVNPAINHVPSIGPAARPSTLGDGAAAARSADLV
jgi:2-polyprenyl-6-methoxyphenol hydroxylase-like FAD-dependent oxidoreductase